MGLTGFIFFFVQHTNILLQQYTGKHTGNENKSMNM